MIKHVVMVVFKPGISLGEREDLAKKLVQTLSQIPGARNVTAGQASEVGGKARYHAAIFIDFDSEAALTKYLDHPVHKAAAGQIGTVVSDVLVSDYAC